MGKEITEGNLTFTFPNSWKASCYDKWNFYRKHFVKICNETKAIDILALEPSNNCAWLIEVKLRKKVKAIDSHPLVLEKANSTKMVDWIVT